MDWGWWSLGGLLIILPLGCPLKSAKEKTEHGGAGGRVEANIPGRRGSVSKGMEEGLRQGVDEGMKVGERGRNSPCLPHPWRQEPMTWG